MRCIAILGTAYLLIYWCVYLTHNYILSVIKGKTEMSNKEYSILDMLYIIKFVGSFFWSNLADRTKKHKNILVVGLMGFAVTLSAFSFAPDRVKAHHLNVYTFIYRSLNLFFLSAIFATIDSVCLNYLEFKGQERKLYGKIKIMTCVGQVIAHLCVSQEGTFDKKDGNDNHFIIILTLLIATIASIFIFFSFRIFEERNIVKIKTRAPFRRRIASNLKNTKGLLTITFFLLIAFITLQGIHRQTISTFLPTFYEAVEIKKKEIPMMFAVRGFPEAIMLFLTPSIDKLIGIRWMLFLSVFFGVSRPFAFACLDIKSYTRTKKFVVVLSIEIAKGIFSGLFGYAGSKLLKDISTPKTRSLARGFFNGCYSGLAPCISGIIGYIHLGKDESKDVLHAEITSLFNFVAWLGVLGLLLLTIVIYRYSLQKRREAKSPIIDPEIIKSAELLIK